MSIQEAALYGDLVLALRDYAAERLASMTPCKDLDEFIRTWLFTPQEELYGSSPRDVIWREQLGEGNPIHVSMLPKPTATVTARSARCCAKRSRTLKATKRTAIAGPIAPTRACSIATIPKAAKSAGDGNLKACRPGEVALRTENLTGYLSHHGLQEMPE